MLPFIISYLLIFPTIKGFSSGSSKNIVLWNSGVWPYAQRPWIALLEKSVPFKHILIDLSNKPTEFLDKYQLASGNRRGLVPLLEHGDNLVIESDVVAKYVAQDIVGGKGDWGLYPTSEEGKEFVSIFLSEWDSVTDQYYSVLTATSQAQVDRRKFSYIQSLEAIEKLLKQRRTSGDFVCNNFSYAECISAPWIQRMYVTMPYFRGINFENDILLSNNLNCVSKWMKAVCNRQSCIESKCPEEEMIAACKRYYVSYISPGASGYL